MRILVVGAGGQVGSKVSHRASQKGHSVVGTFLTRRPSDIEAEYQMDKTKRDQVQRVVSEAKPDVIVDTGALHNVDYCEEHPEEAFSVNRDGTEYLAAESKVCGARYIYVSTDYVFDGFAAPYSEESNTAPLSDSDLSKIQGEQNALYFNSQNAVVVRPSVIYSWVTDSKQKQSSSSGKPLNFAVWLVNQLIANKEVKIVDDQVGSPTLADDLAGAIIALCESKATGVFHTAGATPVNRYDFSVKIAQKLGLKESLIHPVKTSALVQKARRPLNSSLLSERIRNEVRYNMMALDNALEIFQSQCKADLL
jgi:dTDP-4-dehydrorhamnose reductase